MADITVHNYATAGGSVYTEHKPRRLVWTSPTTVYQFFHEQAGNNWMAVYYKKSTDGGQTWGSGVGVETSNFISAYQIWFDQWTSNSDTGSTIHIALVDDTNERIDYRTLDTDTDTLSSATTVASGLPEITSSSDFDDVEAEIVKSRGGTLYVGYNDGANSGLWSSTNGTTWTSIDDGFAEGVSDEFIFMPGNEADADDFWCIFWDNDASEIDLKVYDASANTWSTTNIATGMTANQFNYLMDAAPRHSDNHVIHAAWEDRGSSTADLRCWDIGGAGSMTELTAVEANLEGTNVGILVNQQNDDIYVSFLHGTVLTDTDASYRLSTDGGTTWGSRTQLNVTTDDYRAIFGGTSVNDQGGRFMPTWLDDDDDLLLTNYDNSIEIAAAAGGVTIALDGAAFARGRATGRFDAQPATAGVARARAVVIAAAAISQAIAGDAQGRGQAAGAIDPQQILAGIARGRAIATGATGRTIALDGELFAHGRAAGRVSLTGQLIGSVVSSGRCVGLIASVQGLAGEAIGISTTGGAAAISAGLTGSTIVNARLTAAPTVAQQLAGELHARGRVVAEVQFLGADVVIVSFSSVSIVPWFSASSVELDADLRATSIEIEPADPAPGS